MLALVKQTLRGFRALALAAIVGLAAIITTGHGIARDTPPPVPGSVGVEVYLIEGGAQAGPFTLEQLKAKVATGVLTPNTQAWIKGMPAWQNASTIPALAGLFGATPPPPPETNTNANNYLAGRWVGDPQQIPVEGFGMGTLKGWTEYDPRGAIKGEAIITWQAQLGITYTRTAKIQGTYKAVYKNANTISVTLKSSMVIKTVSSTGNPVPPETKQWNHSFEVTIVDNNTTRSPEGGISRRTPPR